MQYLLVEEGLNVERLHDVCVELREQEGVPDALVQQFPHLQRRQKLSTSPSSMESELCSMGRD